MFDGRIRNSILWIVYQEVKLFLLLLLMYMVLFSHYLALLYVNVNFIHCVRLISEITTARLDYHHVKPVLQKVTINSQKNSTVMERDIGMIGMECVN